MKTYFFSKVFSKEFSIVMRFNCFVYTKFGFLSNYYEIYLKIAFKCDICTVK
jgi:hypothetical protein